MSTVVVNKSSSEIECLFYTFKYSNESLLATKFTLSPNESKSIDDTWEIETFSIDIGREYDVCTDKDDKYILSPVPIRNLLYEQNTDVGTDTLTFTFCDNPLYNLTIHNMLNRDLTFRSLGKLKYIMRK